MATILATSERNTIVSNTKRTRWAAEQVTAANAEALLAELATSVADEDPVTRSLLLRVWDVLDEQGRAGEFAALADRIRADAARKVLTARLTADLAARGHPPGVIALVEQRLMELGDDYWLDFAREFFAA
jgi:hypothetical protein